MLLLWGITILGAIGIYLFSSGLFLRWVESAPTMKEYDRRNAIVEKIYSPMIWLEEADPTGTLDRLTEAWGSLWHNRNFDEDRLPPA